MIENKRQQIVPLDPVTFHVFQWLCHGGQVDVEALAKKAFDTPEMCDAYLFGDGGVHDAVWPRLAELIDEQLSQYLDDWVTQLGDFLSVQECELFTEPDYAPEPPLDLADLFLPILRERFEKVEAFRIAEAILRRDGRWIKQDPHRPELLPPKPEQDRREE